MELKHAHDVLGVELGATREEARRGLRELAKSLAPNRRPKTTTALEHAAMDARWLQASTALTTILGHIDQMEKLTEALRGSADLGRTTTAPSVARAPGVEMSASITIPVSTSVHGGVHQTQVQLDRTRTFELDVPRGVLLGHRFRIVGAGGQGDPPGDLVLVVGGWVKDSRFGRDMVKDEPLTLTTTRRVTYWQVYVGRWISVTTPWGSEALQLRRGDVRGTYRIREHGVRVGQESGDLLVDLDVVFPPPGDDALARALLAAQGGGGDEGR
jgi:DnaJ-class molecular chaperone